MKRHLQRIGTRTLALLTVLIFIAPVTAGAEETATGAETYTPRGSVARAVFTSRIEDREPIDNLVRIPSSADRIYFFSDLRGLDGEIITHRWEYDGQVMAEVKFRVGSGTRWRVYSSKNLLPEWIGKWTVVVLDESGWPLKASMFEYFDASQDATPITQQDTPPVTDKLPPEAPIDETQGGQ